METCKALTYDQFQSLAMKYYDRGGDGYVECWDRNTFDQYVQDCGPITRKKALEMFGISKEIDDEYRAAAMYFGGF